MEIELKEVSKSFGGGAEIKVAVDRVSWKARSPEVFGLLGPNGAGKTTMIRMMLDIIRPDEGQVLIDRDARGSQSQSFKRRLGYLPEERGLYKKRKVIDVLTYFAVLKGLLRPAAKRRSLELLERFELADWAHNKIEDLSKGMSQKLQMASCLIHDPEMVVLDEPFAGLDPVNVRLIREIILELKAGGKLVFLSTHMMGEVEALCDRIFMIHQGREVLYGDLGEIKKSYTDHEVLLDADAQPEGLNCVADIKITQAGKCVHLKPGRTMHDLLVEMGSGRRALKRLEEATTPIEEIFVSLVKDQGDGHG